MNTGRDKTSEFVNRIEKLIDSISDSGTVTDSVGDEHNEKDYLKYLVKNANELIHYGEWLIALEILLDNLAEVNYKLDNDIWSLAKSASLYAPQGWEYDDVLLAILQG